MRHDIEFPTVEEEAAIQAGIALDADNPELAEAFFGQAVRVQDVPDAQLDVVLPAAVAAMVRRQRGPQLTPTKEQIALRVDRDVMDALRAGGRGWQSRANALLRKGVGL